MIYKSFIFYLFFTLFSFASAEIKKAKFITALDKDSILLKYSTEYYETIFQKIPDYKFEIVSIPNVQSEDKFMSDNRYVGDLVRFDEFKSRHPELLQIPLPFIATVVCIVKKESHVKNCDIETLKKLKISKQRGSILLNNYFKKNKLKETLKFYAIQQSLQQLDQGSIDIVLMLGRVTKKIELPDEKSLNYRVVESNYAKQLFTYIRPENFALAKAIKKQVEILNKNKKELEIYKKYFPKI